KPLRVYHGSKANFDAFDMGRAGESSTEVGKVLSSAGAWFSPTPELAEKFADRAPGVDGQNISAVFLKMEKPFEWNWSDTTPRDIAPGPRKGSTARALEKIKADGFDG